MNGHTEPSKERMLQLLVDHATDGLDLTSAAELASLLSLYPEYDESCFELPMAAIDLAMMPRSAEPLSKELRDRILLDAGRFFETGEE
ncbi:MAG: hypothetical protein PVI86_06145 [Phycisphaerae bacterium]|jgi:hypothetical protein